MSDTPENKLSNEILSMNNLLGDNMSMEKEQTENQAQNNDIAQNQDQIQSQNPIQDQNQDHVQDNDDVQNQNQSENQVQDIEIVQNQDQDQNNDQIQDQDNSQVQNQDNSQAQEQDNSQAQEQDNLQAQNQENDPEKENQIEEESDPTKNVFATIDDGLELLVPSKNNPDTTSSGKNVSKSQPQKIPYKPFYVKKPQHAVLKFLDDKPKPDKRKTLESIIHIKQPTHNFTPDEISQYTDSYLKTDKIQMDDPMIVSEIIEELTSRYIELLSKNEYIQAQNILNKIQYLRDQFRTKDAVLFMEKHLEDLKTKRTTLENELKSTRSVWKTKQKELDESFKKESDELQEKQQELWDKMEKDWNDPSRQRKYSKESKNLLLGRQAERYMMLAGDLEGAEMMKKKNKQLEKIETVEAYNEMSNDFENAKIKLTKFFEKQENELDEQQRLKKIALKRDELDHVALIRKKIDILDKMIIDESNPIFKEKKIKHSRLVNSTELPMLQRTAKNITAKNQLFMKTAQISSKPLQLPPLKMAPRPTKKAKSNLSRPIAH